MPSVPAAMWYVMLGETETGPLTRVDVGVEAASGAINGETLVWREGMADPITRRPDPTRGLTAPSRADYDDVRPHALSPPVPRPSEVVPCSASMRPRTIPTGY